MSAPEGALTKRRRRVPAVVIVAIVCAWLLVILAQVTGQAENVHHGAMIEGDQLGWSSLAGFSCWPGR